MSRARAIASLSPVIVALLTAPSQALCQPQAGQAALPSGDSVKLHTAALAHDSMLGRFPGTPGGDAAARYIAERFRLAGLEPGGPAGSFLVPVPLRGLRPLASSIEARAVCGDSSMALPASAIALQSEVGRRNVDAAGAIVFVGYGIDAPEHGWSDYSRVSAGGAWVAVLSGLPPDASGVLPGGADSYYGEDEAKLDAARRRGARGVLFLRSPDRAEGFVEDRAEIAGFEHLTPAWGRRHALDGIVRLSAEASSELLGLCGSSYARLESAAASRDATGGPPGGFGDAWFSLRFEQEVRRFEAPNVVGALPGTDPTAGTVVLMAHYDGLGTGPSDERGDTIYNGAVDNASGTAGLIELARVIGLLEPRFPRNLVFVATTAEEADHVQIGARHYAEHPARPLEETVVALNLDGLNWRQPTDDFRFFPVTGTTARPVLEEVGQRLAMELEQPAWGGGLHFSFDTIEFLSRGIAGLTIWAGSSYRPASDPDDAALQDRLNRPSAIHQPADEYWDDWSAAALAQNLEMYLGLIDRYAADEPPPRVTPDGPFAPLMESASPKAAAPDDLPWAELARVIVDRLAPSDGERVILLCHEGRFEPLVPELRFALMKAGAAELGCLTVLSRPYPERWDEGAVAAGFERSRTAIRELLLGVDAAIVLPGAWPTEPAYAALQDVLRSGHGRAVHFHWHGGFDLRGRQLAVDRSIDRTYLKAVLDSDHDALAARQAEFADAVRRSTVRVTTPAGTDISFWVGTRPVTRQDGDASRERAAAAANLIDREVEIPSGAVRFAPIEESVSGVIVLAGASRWAGEWARDVRLRFEDGRLVSAEAAERVDAVHVELEDGGDTARSFGGFALGFNPLLAVPENDPWIPYYGYGAGVVRLSLGHSDELGGAVRGDYKRWNFFTDATVTAGGRVWVRDGRLVDPVE